MNDIPWAVGKLNCWIVWVEIEIENGVGGDEWYVERDELGLC